MACSSKPPLRDMEAPYYVLSLEFFNWVAGLQLKTPIKGHGPSRLGCFPISHFINLPKLKSIHQPKPSNPDFSLFKQLDHDDVLAGDSPLDLKDKAVGSRRG
ncbi:Hypothetical predicted protein [Prunus dulcis]|uniref:Uncharacterized protein n=1 Tax=Prunus dulcis TaxID=3755 RepID=A0A5E4GJM4_PRUDU|nr:Hypothetical predicted protein [Prunus dulcis]